MTRAARRASAFSTPACLAVVAVLCAGLAAPGPAHACGGFFCNTSQPVNQAAERIIFSVAGDGTVTATIQIQYAGDAASFAWVLPVSGSPEIRVSSDLAFQRLQAATNPSYLLTTTVSGACRDGFVAGLGSGPRADAAASAGPDGGAVRIVDSGTVGPYDFSVISIEPGTPLVTDAAVTWLRDNGYQIDVAAAERLAPYLEAGMNLLAFRLTSGRSVGSIRPVEITFGAGTPSIPIRPTAVAAVRDMGVMVWVLGHSRAIPVNYMSLELNEALINWVSPGSTYDDVVNEAANQAGGQGFVTEMAGDAAPLATVILAEWESTSWEALRTAVWTNREMELIQGAFTTFGRFDGIRDVAAATMPVPTGRTLDEVLACPSCVYGRTETDIAGFEPAAFLAALESSVIEPMQRTRDLFLDHAFVTRFYTTMSADEMTRDPMFDFNSNLGFVSNVHNATRVIECSPSIRLSEAPWHVTLPDGETVRGVGPSWPFTTSDGSMPANARIRRLETAGEGVIVVDNVASIRATVAAHNATIPRLTRRVAGGGGACNAARRGGSVTPFLSLLAAVVGLAVRARRRRVR